jgi:hypothetical protein
MMETRCSSKPARKSPRTSTAPRTLRCRRRPTVRATSSLLADVQVPMAAHLRGEKGQPSISREIPMKP